MGVRFTLQCQKSTLFDSCTCVDCHAIIIVNYILLPLVLAKPFICAFLSLCCTQFGATCLHMAVKEGQVAIVRQLLQFNCDLTIRDEVGMTTQGQCAS